MASDPFAVGCILHEQQCHRVSSIATHGEKLYIGHPSGALSIYRLPSSSSSTSNVEESTAAATHISTHASFHPANKAVNSLRIVPSLSLILSSCQDGSLHFNSLATLEPVPTPAPLKALPAKGLVSFEVQTSVVEWKEDAPPQAKPSRTVAKTAGGTLPRGGVTSPPRPRPTSMYQRRDAASRQPQSPPPQANLRLVTTAAVSMRRKLFIVRWIDGQPWDWKEIALPHTPRSLAFSPAQPTTIFISYGTASEFAILDVPQPYDSSAAVRRAGSSSTDFVKDESEWAKVRELNIPEYSSPAASEPSAGPSNSTGGENASKISAAGAKATQGGDAGKAGLPGGAAAGGIFGGLGGYIGLGARSKLPMVRAAPKPRSEGEGSSSSESEVVVVRDNTAIFLSFKTGNPTRRRGVEWPTAVEDVGLLSSGHLFAAVPAHGNAQPKPVLQIRATTSLDTVQSVSLPVKDEAASTSQHTITTLLAPPTSSSTSLYAVATPSSSSEPARIYRLTPRPWRSRLREMIRARKWEEAVDLTRSALVGESEGEEGASAVRTKLVPPLLALVSLDVFLTACHAAERKQMHAAQVGFEAAVEQWIELDLNPAKILSIFPESIAGQGLTAPPGEWIKVWGEGLEQEGFSLDDVEPVQAVSVPHRPAEMRSRRGSTSSSIAPSVTGEAAAASKDRTRLTSLFGRVSRPVSMMGGEAPAVAGTSPKPDSVLNAVLAPGSPAKGASERPSRLPTKATTAVANDAASLRSAAASPSRSESEAGIDPHILVSRPALEALGRFLADRRRIFKPILEDRPSVSPTSHEAMLSLPSIPLPSMSLEDLTALARVVDTSLFKTFLETKPSLVGPLCRIENWCEVSEVEGILEAKGKFSELIHLYGGKEMHDKALKLLKKFADEEDDEEEKVGPTIRYLQSLGPEHIGVILENAKWVLAEDRQRGMEIFTADMGKVSQLPRMEVVELLWGLDEDMCAQYLEHIIHEVGDGDPELHERLALIYLRRVRAQETAKEEDQTRLLTFLSQSQQYRPERLLTQLPSEGLWEVRAVLLGRMGRHQGALSILVERIGGEEGRQKAEAYCADVYARRNDADGQGDKDIFLLLFKLYLRSAVDQQGQGDEDPTPRLGDLDAALHLLSTHAASLDLCAVLDLLPPLVPLYSLRAFLVKGLQASHRRRFDASVLSSVSKERDSQLDAGMAVLRGRRVKVTQGRTCPKCGKRLGVSVIAVTGRGEVLHYGCRQQQQQRQKQEEDEAAREKRDWEAVSSRGVADGRL